MTDIIIVGYPKSGNTWVARLVAELIVCPVVGFWDYDHNEIAKEGLDRESDFRCFKSHHQLSELSESTTGDEKVIYVVRDPRDVAISGAHYFDIKRWPDFARRVDYLLNGRKNDGKIIQSLFTSQSYRISRMVQTVLYGSEDTHFWTRLSWANHYKPFMQEQYFYVKYEDLLEDPFRECKKILEFLGLDLADEGIREAIKNQSFEKKKASFISNKQLARANFMRKGKSEQWRHVLSAKQKRQFNKLLNKDLERFGYALD